MTTTLRWIAGIAPFVFTLHISALEKLTESDLRAGSLKTLDTPRSFPGIASFAKQGMVAFGYDMVGYNDTTEASHKFAVNPTNQLWNISLNGIADRCGQNALPGDSLRSYEPGVNAYVVKPVNFGQFSTTVRQFGKSWGELNEPPPDCLSGPC